MSCRQSERVRHPGYRPQTTWRLPKIVSVVFFFSCFHIYNQWFSGRSSNGVSKSDALSSNDDRIEETHLSNTSTFHPRMNLDAGVENSGSGPDSRGFLVLTVGLRVRTGYITDRINFHIRKLFLTNFLLFRI